MIQGKILVPCIKVACITICPSPKHILVEKLLKKNNLFDTKFDALDLAPGGGGTQLPF